MEKSVLRMLFTEVEDAWPGKAFWEAFVGAARACQGRASEYELYYAFVISRFPHKVQTRALPFAVVADIQATLSNPPEVAFAVAHSHLRSLPAEDLRDRLGIINGDTQREVLRRLAGESLADTEASELMSILKGW